MTLTQSGYPVGPPKSAIDRSFAVEGVTFPGGVLAGPVATVLAYVAGRWHREIEPLRAGWCWGGYVKTITGGSGWSNHAGFAAIDINAPAHPQHKRTLTAAQYTIARRIVADCQGVVRWGGDFGARDLDEMHWEIAPGKAGVAVVALARKLTSKPPQEDDMPTAKEVAEAMRPVIREEIEAALTGGVKVVWEDSRLRPTREREDSIVGALARAAVYSSNASGGVDQLARISGAEPEDRT